MAEPSAVRKADWQRIQRIGQVDLLIGIPSFDNAATIGHVVQTVAEGAARHFPGLRAVVANSDGGSKDGTRDAVEVVPVPRGVAKVSFEYQGLPGKGSAFRAIFEVARYLGVRACVVVDSDLRSITTDWIRALAAPAIDGRFEYVAPYYLRHKYDGTITNSIAYPLTAALYGVSVRQPIGGDFGFSATLLDHYLSQDVWSSDVARFGIDIWMTTIAINEGFRVAQARLGAKVHDAKDPAASLGPMFRQVVGTILRMMGRYEAAWRRSKPVEEAPTLGEEVSIEPEAVPVTVQAMVDRFQAACQRDRSAWEQVLAADNLRAVDEIAQLPESRHGFPQDLWVKVVYDFAAAYNRGSLGPDRVVDALTGLYYARTAAFCTETAGMTTAQAEAGPIRSLARRFEQLKPYLVERWAS